MRLFHIAHREDWERAREVGFYAPASLEREGFIHCSLAHPLRAVADALFRGERGLWLLVIDPGRLGAEVRFEDAGAGEAYPHVYGPVPLSAIERVFALPLGSDGRVVLPEGF